MNECADEDDFTLYFRDPDDNRLEELDEYLEKRILRGNRDSVFYS